jgi:hypothetical protein
MRKFSHYNQCPGRGSKRAPPEYKPGLFPLHQFVLYEYINFTLTECYISHYVLEGFCTIYSLFGYQCFGAKQQNGGRKFFLNICKHLKGYTVSKFRKSQSKFSPSFVRTSPHIHAVSHSFTSCDISSVVSNENTGLKE